MTRKLRTASNVGPLGCWDNLFFQHIGFQQVSFAGLVPVNAVGDVPGPIATLGQVIENQTSGATVAARFLTTDANVKVLAISWVSVQWVNELGSCWLSLKNSGRAIKCNDVFALATDTVSLSWPGASASVGVENETVGAGDQIGLAGRAEEELVADSWVAVCEVAILARAVGRSVSRLEFGAASAIDVEGEITSATNAAVGSQVGKDQTIVAEFLAEDEILALVVTIALKAVGEDTVLLRTITLRLLSVD